MTKPYTIDEVAEWLCSGEICGEERCKVLGEDCCPCAFAGNALVRLTADLQAKDKRIAELEDALKIALDEWKAWMDDADEGDFSGSDNSDRKSWHKQNEALAALKEAQ